MKYWIIFEILNLKNFLGIKLLEGLICESWDRGQRWSSRTYFLLKLKIFGSWNMSNEKNSDVVFAILDLIVSMLRMRRTAVIAAWMVSVPCLRLLLPRHLVFRPHLLTHQDNPSLLFRLLPLILLEHVSHLSDFIGYLSAHNECQIGDSWFRRFM